MRGIVLFFLLLAMVNEAEAYQQVACSPDATCSHAISMWDTPKYGLDAQHFDYTNPDAMKGGHVKYAVIGTFDSLNSHILKGIPAAGLDNLYDTLITDSGDEPFTKYGLLAHTIELAKDRSWVVYHLRPEARWHDGKAITAEDVAWSFDTLMEKGHPYYRSYYREVAGAEALDAHRVKFTFSNPRNRELPLILGQLPILPKHYYATRDITQTSLELPLGSGPYKVAEVDPGKWIRYAREEDYWGKDLLVNKGRYNFDRITYDYYRDATVAVEAFKAGEYDIRVENIAKTWANAYDFPAIREGKVVKEVIPHERPAGMQGTVFNTRRDLFKNRMVRKALNYVFDFEWTNEQLFFGAYTRTTSYFQNSPFASSGLPQGRELEILEEFKDQLQPEVFTEEFEVPVTDGSGNNRVHLVKARDILLNQAGCEMRERVLYCPSAPDAKDHKQLNIEFLLNSPSFERVIGPMVQKLKKLGVEATIRTVDSAQYIKRLEQFDFDMTVNVFGQSLSPGNEQEDYWHSSRANVPGTRNLIGVNHPVVDALVERIIRAEDKDTLVHTTRALDRVLLHQYYVIPNWHLGKHRVIYWNRFGQPDTRQDYLLGVDTWWVEPEKDASLELAR